MQDLSLQACVYLVLLANTDKKSVSGTNISVVQETPVLSRTVAKGGDVSLISETVMYASDQDDDDVRSLDDSNISKPPLPAGLYCVFLFNAIVCYSLQRLLVMQ